MDYTKLWDWVVDLINAGVFPDAEYVDGDKLVGIFTFDGRSIGGRSQIYVGLKFPYLNWGKTQSSDVIFPVAILPGSDGVKNTAAKFNSLTVAGGSSLMDQLRQIKHADPRMVQHHGQEKQIRFVQHFAAGQKSEWGFYDICQKVMSDENPDAEICTYCTCCNDPNQKADFTKTHPVRDRSDLPFNPTTDSTFCLLHMKLRCPERMFWLAASKAKRTSKMGKLEAAVRKLDINMTIESKKGKLSVTSMNGKDVEKLVAGRAEWLAALELPDTPKMMGDGTKEPLSKLWREIWDLWDEIFKGLNARYGVQGPSTAEVDALNKKVDRYGQVFLALYELKHVTPYVHILMKHSVEHLVRFKELWRYANEGFEAANKRHRFWYARCTQRGGECGGKNQHAKSHSRQGTRSCSLRQLMLKNLRVLSNELNHLRGAAEMARAAEELEDDEIEECELPDSSDTTYDNEDEGEDVGNDDAGHECGDSGDEGDDEIEGGSEQAENVHACSNGVQQQPPQQLQQPDVWATNTQSG